MVSRDSSGDIAIGYDRRRALGMLAVAAVFFAICLLVVESSVGRAAGILGLTLTIAGFVRVANPRPQVVLNDAEIVVGGRWTSAVNGRRRARWEQVESVDPIRLTPPFESMQQGRVPTYPAWMERQIPREFRVRSKEGTSLMIREPLDRPLEEVRAEVVRRTTLRRP